MEETGNNQETERNEKKADYAVLEFSSGYNCSQSVLSAFAAEMNAWKDDAVKYAAGFGSGIGTGKTCGACTGAVMAAGLYTSGIEDNDERKSRTYGIVREYFKKFEERFGSSDCRQLLGYDIMDKEKVKSLPGDKSPKTFCRKFVRESVMIMSEIIDEDRLKNQE